VAERGRSGLTTKEPLPRILSDYQKGLLFTTCGVLTLTPDALLVRLIQVESWALLFWRGILMSLGFSLFLLWKRIPLGKLNARGWLAAVFLACSTTCFVFSLEHTHAANTLVIIATSPLIAAILSQAFLKERVPLVTWAAIAVATLGVLLSLSDGLGRGSLKGELFAGVSAVSMACHFTTLRWWKSEYGPLSIWGAGLVAAILALPFAESLRVPSADIGWVVLLGLVLLPTAFGLMAVGPRYLPAPEVGLLLLGETVLGPVWVWMAVGEEPGKATLGGGALVIVTLAAHAAFRRRAS
jgi:drug/metabolite transporter (DMT)-like permease